MITKSRYRKVYIRTHMAKIEIFRVAALVFRTVNFVSTISSAVFVHVTQV